MEFFCFHRDRPGSTPLRERMVEEHWAYMDGFADAMIARGPTFTTDGTLSGSVHALELAGPAAARAFAFEEPCYQAGAYRDVMVRRWHNVLGRTMWQYEPAGNGSTRFLVLGLGDPASRAPELPGGPEVIVGGPLLSDDGRWVVGVALLLEARDAEHALGLLPPTGHASIEVHEWQFGGRPE